MRKSMKSYLLLALLLCVSEVLAFDVQTIIEKMRPGQNVKTGETKETGKWVLVKSIVKKDSNLTDAEINELGLVLAKKSIAAFWGGTMVNSTETTKTEAIESNVNGKNYSEIEETYNATLSTDINHFLRGVSIVSVIDHEDAKWIYCFSSESIQNAAAEMEAKKLQLPPNTVEAIGISSLPTETISVQRQQALASAQRIAVEQVLGNVVSNTTQVQDNVKIQSRIYASAAGFIEECRIVSEGSFSGGYRVRIIAKVSKDKLLSDYSAIMKSMGDPSFMIRTNQKDLYHSLSDFFSGLGLRIVVDASNADYFINAMGDFRQVIHPVSRIAGIQLSLWVTITDANSGQELITQKNDPRKASVFHSSGERQVELAAEKAYKQIRQPLHEKINTLLGKMSSTGREIRVIVQNYSNELSPELEIIVKAVERIPGCSNVNMNIDGINGKATIRANYTATMEALAKFLGTRLNKEILSSSRRPRIVSFSNSELHLSY